MLINIKKKKCSTDSEADYISDRNIKDVIFEKGIVHIDLHIK